MSYPQTSSITISLSPSVPRTHFPPRRCRNSNNRDSGGRPHYTNNSQKKLRSPGDSDTSTSNITTTMNILSLIVKKKYTFGYTHKKNVSTPLSNRSGILYYQLSRILFFNNLFQQNYLSLLRTSRCGILLNQRITAFQRNYSFCLFPHWFLAEGSPCQNPRTNPCFPLSGNDSQIVDLEF